MGMHDGETSEVMKKLRKSGTKRALWQGVEFFCKKILLDMTGKTQYTETNTCYQRVENATTYYQS
jgi:hypothetical protein